MRHVNDHLSYKTYVANFFNFSNFFNFKQVELAKLESIMEKDWGWRDQIPHWLHTQMTLDKC